MGQNRECRALFDHLVGACYQRGRDGEAERLRRLEIDHQLEFGGLYHRQISGLGPLQDLASVDACLSISVGNTASVTHQTPNCREFVQRINRRNRIVTRQRDELLRMTIEEWVASDDNRLNLTLGKTGKRRFKVKFGSRFRDNDLLSEGASRRFHLLYVSVCP